MTIEFTVGWFFVFALLGGVAVVVYALLVLLGLLKQRGRESPTALLALGSALIIVLVTLKVNDSLPSPFDTLVTVLAYAIFVGAMLVGRRESQQRTHSHSLQDDAVSSRT